MSNNDIETVVKKLVKKELENYGVLVDGSANNATYLHIVNTSSTAITVSLVANMNATQTVIGNVSGSSSSVPIDLRGRGLTNGWNYRLSIRPRGSTAAWVTFNSSFTFIEPAVGTTPPLMRASYQLSSKGSWTCAGPTFGPATATRTSANREEPEDLPGDPLNS